MPFFMQWMARRVLINVVGWLVGWDGAGAGAGAGFYGVVERRGDERRGEESGEAGK